MQKWYQGHSALSSLIALYDSNCKDIIMNTTYPIKSFLLVLIFMYKGQANNSFFLYECTYITTQTQQDATLCFKQKHHKSSSSFFIDEAKQIEVILKKDSSTPICFLILQGFFFSSTPSISWGLSFYDIFPEFNICTINLVGYQQHITIDSTCLKIIAVYNYLVDQGLEPIFLACCFSSMLVTTIFAEYSQALKKKPIAVIFDSAFSNFETIKKNIHKTKSNYFLECLLWLPGGIEFCAWWYDGTIFSKNPIDSAKKCTVPTLMIHAEKDFLVPLDEALELYKNLSSPKKNFVISTEGNHTSIHKIVPHQYGLICKAWIESLLLT